MKKTNRIRLFFLLGTVFCLGSYFCGYHYITGDYPYEPEDFTQLISENNKETEIKETEAETEIETEIETEMAVESASIQKNYEYVVVEEDGYLTVYHADLKTKYMDTDITMQELGKDMQKEIQEGKKFENAEDLYNFLENYSS